MPFLFGEIAIKKRLRKKLFLGEFQEILVKVEIQTDATHVDQDAFLDSWIDEVEANDMMCAGGGKDGKWSFVVDCNADLEVSREKRERLAAWLQAEPRVEEFTLSPICADLTRAFHSSPDAATRQQKMNRERGIESVIWHEL